MSMNSQTSIPSTMKAIVTTGEKGKVHLKSVSTPQPGPGQILVKVVAAAQNPSEWMKLARATKPDIPVGHDFAGIVVAIGEDVPIGLRTIGERVAGFVNAFQSIEMGGTFAEYTVADAQVLINIPESMSFEDAATLGLAGFTACQTLWQHQDLADPYEPARNGHLPILIWGGASSVGQYAIQLAKLSGLRVFSTASPKNHQLLRDLGVDEVYDHRDPAVSRKIIEATNGKLAHVVDCISSGETPRQISECLGEGEACVALVLPADVPGHDKVKSDFTFVYTLLGKAIPPPFEYPAIPAHYELGKKFGKLLGQLLVEEKLRATPVKLVPNGLVDAQYWIEYQQQGKVHAEKIVYRVSDIPP